MTELITVPNCVADGMDLDRDSNIWLTCYSFGTAYLVNPSGKIIHTITTAQKALTNCFFGRGADRATLYLTSSDMERVTAISTVPRYESPAFDKPAAVGLSASYSGSTTFEPCRAQSVDDRHHVASQTDRSKSLVNPSDRILSTPRHEG